MRNSGNSLIHELTEVAISKEQRLGVSLNSFMKVAFGVYNPHYEGLSNGSIDGTSRVDYFGDDLNWIRIAPAKPVRRQSTPTETETGSEEVPEKKTNIWGN